MTRPPVSFAAMSAAEADVQRVTAELRQRITELDRELTPVLPALDADDVERLRAARGRCGDAVADLCAVLDQICTALGTARDAGRPSTYVRPGWS